MTTLPKGSALRSRRRRPTSRSRSGLTRPGDRFTGLTRCGLGRDGARHPGSEGVGTAKLGLGRSREPTCWHPASRSRRLGDPAGCAFGGHGRNAGDAGCPCHPAGQPWHPRLRLCRSPLWVQTHGDYPAAGCRVADRRVTVTFTPNAVHPIRRCGRRRRRGRHGRLISRFMHRHNRSRLIVAFRPLVSPDLMRTY